MTKKTTKLITAISLAILFSFSYSALAQDEDFESDFALDEDTEKKEADLDDLLGEKEKVNSDLFPVQNWETLVKIVHFVDRYWYTVINNDYVSRAKTNAETQLADNFAKVKLLFGEYGIQIPFTGPGEEIDKNLLSKITSYAKGHGCEGNEQSDDCNTLFGKLESAHSKAISGVKNSYTANSTKLMETAAKYDGLDKIILGLGALTMATPGVPEDNRPWDLNSNNFNGIQIDFDDIEEGNVIVTDGNNGLTGGTVIAKGNYGITIADENGNEYTASKEDQFWSLGEGGSGSVNFGSGLSLAPTSRLIKIINPDVNGSGILTIGGEIMWTKNAFGVFLGLHGTRAYGGNASGSDNVISSYKDRWSFMGSVGVLGQISMGNHWSFEGSAAMLYASSGLGVEAKASLVITPTPIISIGMSGIGGFYPGDVITGTHKYEIGGDRNGPKMLDKIGFGGGLFVRFNLPLGD